MDKQYYNPRASGRNAYLQKSSENITQITLFLNVEMQVGEGGV